MYTPSSVSKSLPHVLIVTGPSASGAQRYQTDAPPASPAWLGSPASLVAPWLVPASVIGRAPESSLELAKSSFAGGSTAAKRICVSPWEAIAELGLKPLLSAIEYVTPATAVNDTRVPSENPQRALPLPLVTSVRASTAVPV